MIRPKAGRSTKIDFHTWSPGGGYTSNILNGGMETNKARRSGCPVSEGSFPIKPKTLS